MKTVEETIELIKRLHEGQLDLCGVPYWQHPVAVMSLLRHGADDETKLIALLHDVVEDTPTTLDDLREMGYNDTVVEGVRLLTKADPNNRQTYMEEIAKLCDTGNVRAMLVKSADNLHNGSKERWEQIPEEHKHRRAWMLDRYAKSRAYIEKRLSEINPNQ